MDRLSRVNIGRWTLGVLGGLALFGTAGCNRYPQMQGQTGVVAVYRYPTLTADVPETTRVPAVIAAAEETFRARGYSVLQSSSTEESGLVQALPPRTGDYPRLTVVAVRVPSGTQIRISQEPYGSQELSRSLLDGVLARLGL